MKKLYPLAFITFLLLLFTVQHVSGAPVTSGLVAYYDGEMSNANTVTDISNNIYNGWATGATQGVNTTTGAKFINLTGAAVSKFELGNTINNVTSPFSIEWIGSLHEFRKYAVFGGKYAGGSGGYYLGEGGNSPYNYIRIGGGNGTLVSKDFNTYLELNKVYDIVETYDNNIATVYVNGSSIGSTVWYSALQGVANNASIGWASGMNYTNCSVYTYRLYNRALTSTEVTQNYQNDYWRYNSITPGVVTYGLNAYFDGNLSDPTTVTDKSGNNFNGLATGATQGVNTTSGARYIGLNGSAVSKIDLDNSVVNITSPFTVEWIGSLKAYRQYGILAGKTDGSTAGYYLSLTGTTPYNYLRIAGGNGSVVSKDFNSNIISLNKVYDIVETYDNYTATLYINGTNIGSAIWYTPLRGTTYNQVLGWGQGRNYLNCSVYAYRLYNRSLSPSEITQNYNNDYWRYNAKLPTTPVISWSNPDNISYGTALSSIQLNASVSANGNNPLVNSESFEDNKNFSLTNYQNHLNYFYDNSNSGLNSFTNYLWSQTYTTNTSVSPTHAYRFELKSTDPATEDGTRSELESNWEPPKLERWYNFSLFLPSGGYDDYAHDTHNAGEVIMQWHNNPDNGEEWTRPSLSIITDTLSNGTGYYYLCSLWDDNAISTDDEIDSLGRYNETQLGSYDPDKGHWVKWAFHVKWSWLFSDNPFVRVYKNDSLIYSKDWPDTTNDVKGVNQQFGIYKWEYNLGKSYNPRSNLDHRVLYFDDVSVTNATIDGTFSYSPALGTVLPIGDNQNLTVTFTPTDIGNYSAVSKTVTINVTKATPTITWNNPSNMYSGTPLNATQLNAVASIPGTYTFTPDFGYIPGNGSNNLHVYFVPTDSTNYTTASKDVSVYVNYLVRDLYIQNNTLSIGKSPLISLPILNTTLLQTINVNALQTINKTSPYDIPTEGLWGLV
jgi:hypothetical protein